MKIFLIYLGLVLSFFSINAQQNIYGIWNTGQENTEIEIKSENGIYIGKIISSDNSKVKKGTLILKDVKLISGEWKGELYSLKKKEWFDAILQLNERIIVITVKSEWGSKTMKWTKE